MTENKYCKESICKKKNIIDMGRGLFYLRGISFPALHYLWSLTLSQQKSQKIIVSTRKRIEKNFKPLKP